MARVPGLFIASLLSVVATEAGAACPGVENLKLPMIWSGSPDLAPNFCDKPTWRFIAFGAFKRADGHVVGLVDELKRLDDPAAQKRFLKEAAAAMERLESRFATVPLALEAARAAQAELESLRGKPDADRARMRELLSALIAQEGEPLGAARTPKDARGGPLLDALDDRMLGFARALQSVPFDSGEVKGTVGFYSADLRLQDADRLDEALLRSLWEGDGRTESSEASCAMARPNGKSHGGAPLDRLDDRWGMGLCSAYFGGRDLLNRVNANVRNGAAPFNTVAALLAELDKPPAAPVGAGAASDRAVAVAPGPLAPAVPPATGPRPGAGRQARPQPRPAPSRAARLEAFEGAFERSMRSRLGPHLDQAIQAAERDPAGRGRAATLRALKARVGDFRVTRSRTTEGSRQVERVEYVLVDVKNGRATYTALAAAEIPEPRLSSPLAIEGDERAQTALLNIFYNPSQVEDLARRFKPVVDR